MYKKILFIDRDGTLIEEPEDMQIDSITKLQFKNNVILALLKLQRAGYTFVMVTNQDGLGTSAFPQNKFIPPHQLMLDVFASQGIHFEDILICPHYESAGCDCRKPRLGLVIRYLKSNQLDFKHSYVIGDRQSDLQLAENMGINGILISTENNWNSIANALTTNKRKATIERNTKETRVAITVDLDENATTTITTGIGFFDHMLEQLSKHGGFALKINTTGDLVVDEHHVVEDTAIALGTAFRQALGDKRGISRYGFLLPMDEACAQIALDLCGRSYFVFECNLTREKVGELPTELISHFFRSFADSLGAALHIKVAGENCHHMIESIFKGVGRSLRQAICQHSNVLPSTKGVL